MENVPLSVLLVARHPSNYDVLARWAQRIPGYTISLQVYADPERLPLIPRTDQDLLVLGPDVPLLTAVELLRWLRESEDPRPIIVLSETCDPRLACTILRAGADEFLCTTELSPTLLGKTIGAVLARRRAREAWREAEQLRIVHEMVVSLSHEINNPLQGVVGYLEYVMAHLGPSHPQHARLAAALRAAERIAELVRRLHDVDHVETRPYLAGETMFDLVEAAAVPGRSRSSVDEAATN